MSTRSRLRGGGPIYRRGNSATRRDFLTGIPSAFVGGIGSFRVIGRSGDGSSGDSTDARETGSEVNPADQQRRPTD